mmetsp:Transcript_81254/g.242114  ORF Transcript_81254/g.242114 Transcript_81254/m.242114 type:complete len:435 (+) Transcript_81254:447-1751(+)
MTGAGSAGVLVRDGGEALAERAGVGRGAGGRCTGWGDRGDLLSSTDPCSSWASCGAGSFCGRPPAVRMPEVGVPSLAREVPLSQVAMSASCLPRGLRMLPPTGATILAASVAPAEEPALAVGVRRSAVGTGTVKTWSATRSSLQTTRGTASSKGFGDCCCCCCSCCCARTPSCFRELEHKAVLFAARRRTASALTGDALLGVRVEPAGDTATAGPPGERREGLGEPLPLAPLPLVAPAAASGAGAGSSAAPSTAAPSVTAAAFSGTAGSEEVPWAACCFRRRHSCFVCFSCCLSLAISSSRLLSSLASSPRFLGLLGIVRRMLLVAVLASGVRRIESCGGRRPEACRLPASLLSGEARGCSTPRAGVASNLRQAPVPASSTVGCRGSVGSLASASSPVGGRLGRASWVSRGSPACGDDSDECCWVTSVYSVGAW